MINLNTRNIVEQNMVLHLFQVATLSYSHSACLPHLRDLASVSLYVGWVVWLLCSEHVPSTDYKRVRILALKKLTLCQETDTKQKSQITTGLQIERCYEVKEPIAESSGRIWDKWLFFLFFNSLFLWKLWRQQTEKDLSMESVRVWTWLYMFPHLSVREDDKNWSYCVYPKHKNLSGLLATLSLRQRVFKTPISSSPFSLSCLSCRIFQVLQSSQEPRASEGRMECKEEKMMHLRKTSVMVALRSKM